MGSNSDAVRILLIEDNRADARLTIEILKEAATFPFEVAHALTLENGRARLEDEQFDIVLLDLSLGDANGIPMVATLGADHPMLPLIVLTGLEDEATALAAIQHGAQDYLIKGQGDGHLVARSIRYAIERKRIDCQLIDAKQSAEAASRAKSEFIANMSHELRTPLNAILGFSEIIETGALPEALPKYREYAGYIHRSGSHLNDIISDILDLAKIEQRGHQALNEEAVNIGHTVDFALKLVRERATTAGLTLTADVPPRLPPLLADPRLVKQALLNLLTNSVKFTPEGGMVRVSAGTEGKRRLFVCVADTGVGIAPQYLARIGEPFLQVESATSRNYQGTGLGLALTKAIIELHGGELDLVSRVGLGTSATLRFPSGRMLLQKPERAAAPA